LSKWRDLLLYLQQCVSVRVKQGFGLRGSIQRKSNEPPVTEREDELLVWMQSTWVEDTADYIKRGQVYRSLSVEELTTQWIAAYKTMANNPLDTKSLRIAKAFASEFELRKFEIPYQLVKDDAERYIAAISVATENLEPAMAERGNNLLKRELNNFKAAVKKKN